MCGEIPQFTRPASCARRYACVYCINVLQSRQTWPRRRSVESDRAVGSAAFRVGRDEKPRCYEHGEGLTMCRGGKKVNCMCGRTSTCGSFGCASEAKAGRGGRKSHRLRMRCKCMQEIHNDLSVSRRFPIPYDQRLLPGEVVACPDCPTQAQ